MKESRWATFISIAALVLASVSFYFQFFYVQDAVRVAKLDYESKSYEHKLTLAVTNLGRTQAIVAYLGLQMDGTHFDFKSSEKTPFTLNPNEVKLIEFSSILLEQPPYPFASKEVQEHDVILNARVIGGSGIDRLEHIKIGTFLEQEGRSVGHDLLKFPVDL